MAAKPSRDKVKTLREKRDALGWARVDLNIPPGPALDRLNALTAGDNSQRAKAIIKLLERA